VRKTGRLIVLHEGWSTYGIGAEIIACVCDGPNLILKAPARRISTLETHLPASIVLTKAVLPGSERIDEAVRSVLGAPTEVATKSHECDA